MKNKIWLFSCHWLWNADTKAHVRCKTNNNILLFHPFLRDANDSFVPCFAFVLCIMTSAVPFYMDHKPTQSCLKQTSLEESWKWFGQSSKTRKGNYGLSWVQNSLCVVQYFRGELYFLLTDCYTFLWMIVMRMQWCIKIIAPAKLQLPAKTDRLTRKNHYCASLRQTTMKFEKKKTLDLWYFHLTEIRIASG